MVRLHQGNQYYFKNRGIAAEAACPDQVPENGRKKTLTWKVLEAHNHADNMEHLKIRFDSMGVYDNTYVGILQTAYASGLKEFPMPCVFFQLP